MSHLRKLLMPAMFVMLACRNFKGEEVNLEARASSFLQQRFETVVFARTSVLSRLNFYQSDQEFGAKYLGFPFITLIGGLQAVGPNALKTVEGGASAVLVGSRDFVRPKGLGGVSSHTCVIGVLSSSSVPRLAIGRQFKDVKLEPLDGIAAWTWSIPPSEGYREPTNFYATVVAGSYFVLTDNREDFIQARRTLAASGAEVGMVDSPEIKAVRGNPYWAYRAIRRAKEGDRVPAGLERLPVAARALRMFTNIDDGKLFFDIIVPKNGPSSGREDLPESEVLKFQQAEPGVWRAAISFTTPTQTDNAIFQLMAYFGYGLAL